MPALVQIPPWLWAGFGVCVLVVLAVDSIPAIFGVTKKPFIIFTSNVFAILGLRSLDFVLAKAREYFRHRKVGLSLGLVFIGVKMLPDPHRPSGEAHPGPLRWYPVAIDAWVALAVVATIILGAILTSVAVWRRQRKAAAGPLLEGS